MRVKGFVKTSGGNVNQTAVRPSKSVPTTGMVHLEPPERPGTVFCGAETSRYIDTDVVDCVVCVAMYEAWLDGADV